MKLVHSKAGYDQEEAYFHREEKRLLEKIRAKKKRGAKSDRDVGQRHDQGNSQQHLKKAG